MNKLTTILIAVCCCLCEKNYAQFVLSGTATSSGNRCFQLTKEVTDQYATVWSEKKINLDKGFDVVAIVNFGTKNASGADGITFSLGDDNKYINTFSGSDLCVKGMNACLSVEFDTYQSPGYNDPLYDHIAIQKNGNMVHNGTNTVAGPSPMTALFANVEDGDDHVVRITFNGKTKELKVFFDCNQRISQVIDIKKDIFKGQDAYWGFTAAAGSNPNAQSVCIKRASMLDDYNEITACKDENVNLFSSFGKKYTWSPTTTLNNATIQSPSTIASKSTLYVANVEHECNLVYKDSVRITVPELQPIKPLTDVTICDNQPLSFDAKAKDATAYTWSSGETTSAINVTKSGTYVVTISSPKCQYVGTVSATVNPTPKVNLGADNTICDNQNLLLDATSPNATYVWSDGSTDALLAVKKSDTYWVKVTSDKNCTAADTVKVTIKPTFKSTKTVEICAGSSYAFMGKNWTTDTTVCQTFNTAGAGCDSLYCVKIIVKPNPIGNIQKDICKGDFFEFNKQKYFAQGIFTDTLQAKNGCDSIVIINLVVKEIDTVAIKPIICEGDAYNIGNQTFTKNGNYNIVLNDSQTGCDSIVKVSLKVVPKKGAIRKDTICDGDRSFFGKNYYTKAGTFEETLKNANGCDSIITLTLLVNPKPKTKIVATKNAVCEGGSLVLNSLVADNVIKLQWNNNDIKSSTTIYKSGIYSLVTEDKNGCKNKDSISIALSPLIELQPALKTPSCAGYEDGVITVNSIGGLGAFKYQMNGKNSQSDKTFKGLKEGIYDIKLQDSVGCAADIKVTLLNPKQKSINLNEKVKTIKLGDSTAVLLVTSFADIEKIEWTPSDKIEKINEEETWLKPIQSQFFKIMVKDSAGCVFRDSIKVTVNDEIDIFVPTVFSPNKDGANDELQVYGGIGVAKIIEFSVFDRWGSQIFILENFTNKDNIGWDGSYKEEQMPQGAYGFLVKYEKKNGIKEAKSGIFTLLR